MSIKRWTKDELKLAFYLYCQLPFGRLHSRNPSVVQLASLIGRTSSSVAMKLVNLASLDPDITKSGRRGLGNASDLDREVWREFHADWGQLAGECEAILAARGGSVPEPPGGNPAATDEDYQGRTRSTIIQARVGQSFFRSTVLASYDMQCCMTELAVPALLVASHIVPWSTDSKNRLNPHNGLCLSALHDRAFDEGLITVTDRHLIKVSSSLLKGKANWLGTRALCDMDGKRVQLPARFYPDPRFLNHHSTVIFKP